MNLSQVKIHFIGIGGIGMSGLAELFYNLGANVTGSDQQRNAQTEQLITMGVRVDLGHRADQVGDVDVVVYSSAIPKKNPEYIEAQRKKIPCIPRAEALAEVMRLKKGIAIAGTHGKTTTTSLTASIFLHAQWDPTIVVGGRMDVLQSTSQLGQGEWLIAEADESDGSFLKLNPWMGVITNIDNDHLDFYDSFENIEQSFLNFAHQIPFYGVMVVMGDDPKTRILFESYTKRVLYYGFNKENDFYLESLGASVYRVFSPKGCLGSFRPSLPGRHNALNALASIVVALEAGISFDIAVEAIENFSGVGRRFQFKGKRGEVFFYDDYAHHPTEIKAVLSAFKEKFPERKISILFEPHRFSRTKACWEGFLSCFSEGVDRLYIMDTYSAGESPEMGISSEELCRELNHRVMGEVHYLPMGSSGFSCPEDVYRQYGELMKDLLKELNSTEVFVTLGAGKVHRVCEALVGDNL